MKTDNSNIVFGKYTEVEFTSIVRTWAKNNCAETTFEIRPETCEHFFEGGAKWQKEQLQPLIDSHAELLKICKSLIVHESDHSFIYDTHYFDGAHGCDYEKSEDLKFIFSEIKAAIEKANNLQ